ncbi:hypothetical protein QOZ80_4BG0354810 [Eleusine coracana subsp. coracana]|nr:hypothetical protein QOZ80_4BG0354810 [Eleusine coracana subsp. coracana]
METKNHHVFLLQLVIIGCWVCCVCLAQIPIPSRMDGFVYGRKSPAWGETVVVEAFFDPVCPDSRDAWPVLKKAVEHYGSRVSVVVHLSPLPYHSNAFTACRSINVANKLNPTFVYPLLERFFKYQEGYYNQPTYTRSRATVVDEITSSIVVPIIGEANLEA